MNRRQSSARCGLASGRFARAHKSGSVVRRSDGDSLRAFSLREICCPTQGSPSDRQKTGIHNTAKSGRRNGQPQGCSLRSHRLQRLKPLTPTLSPADHSAMPSMLHCCTSDLKRRDLESDELGQLLSATGARCSHSEKVWRTTHFGGAHSGRSCGADGGQENRGKRSRAYLPPGFLWERAEKIAHRAKR